MRSKRQRKSFTPSSCVPGTSLGMLSRTWHGILMTLSSFPQLHDNGLVEALALYFSAFVT